MHREKKPFSPIILVIMFLKRLIFSLAVFILLAQSAAMAQEREPLAMRIGFEWTILGALGGAAIGALFWLTDPANPNNNLADGVASGAAWGTFVGAGFGAWIMQNNAIFPATVQVNDPLAPENRITSDPVAQEVGQNRLIAGAGRKYAGPPGLFVPVFNLRF